ncbi:hypothetical protein I3679_003875 [Proteus mirabilis]|uniref:Uncharacterized protein n=1 Tax=Proteus mirabilis TaxID=584 RepID=A0ABD5LYL8_PROMI
MHTEGVGLSTIDYAIFALYVIIIISLGLWVSRSKDGAKKEQRITSSRVKHCLGGRLVLLLLLLISQLSNSLVCLAQDFR